MGAFGVEIPDNINEIHAAGEIAPETKEETKLETKEVSNDDVVKEDTKQELTKSEIIELEKLLADKQKFKFNGQELTLKDLQNQLLMRKDYTQKTQELSETRKYVDNFDIDLEKVIENPSLLKQFKEVYPAPFADKAEKILKMVWKDNPETQVTKNAQPNGTPVATQQVPQEILAKLDKLDRLEKWMLGQEQQKQQEKESIIERQLGDWFSDLSTKYKFVDPDAVLTKAQAVAEAGHEITKESLEKIFQEKDAHYQKAWAETQQQKQQKQLNVAAKAREAGKGGDVPMSAPKEAKTLKEIRKSLLKEFD